MSASLLDHIQRSTSNCTAAHPSSLPLPQVPRNLKLLAVPLFELHDNSAKFAAVIAAIPQLLSRFKLNLAGQQLSSAQQAKAASEAEGHGQRLIVSQ